MSTNIHSRAIDCATWLYQKLLRLYPAEFRRAFQQELLQTFRTYCQEAVRMHGARALPRLWLFLLYDLLLTSWIEQYRALLLKLKRLQGTEKEFSMRVPFFQLSVASRTDIGCVRENNEDSLLSLVPENPQILQEKGALFIVADGMGGHNNGEVASELVVRTLQEAYYQEHETGLAQDLQQSMRKANLALIQANGATTDEHSMDTTCIAAVLHNKALYVANVGDGRVYVVHQGTIRQVSEDHSIVAEEMRKGNLTEEEAKVHPERNKIYRSMGMKDVPIDLFTEQVEDGDTVLLCSDGLSQLVSAAEMRATVESYEPEESVERLITLAKERGGPDNITAVVVRVSLP